MLSFLDLVSPLPRSKAAPLNSVMGSGVDTKSPPQTLPSVKPAATYAMRQFISTNPKNIHGSPPHHRYATQTETFAREQGVMKSTAVGGDILAGYTAAIQPHNPVSADPLRVATPADIVTPEDKADEVFFRNLYSYMDDCEKHKRGLSPLQMLMFMTAADTRLALPVIQQGISKMIGFFGGVVASKWFLRLGKGDPEHDGVELDNMEEMNEK